MMKKTIASLSFVAVLTSLSLPVWAEGAMPPPPPPAQNIHPPGAQVNIDEQQREVYQAVKEGKIRPFSELYQTVDAQLFGRVIKVELEKEGHLWVYELKLVYQNKVYKVEYNARNLDMMSIRGKNVIELIKR